MARSTLVVLVLLVVAASAAAFFGVGRSQLARELESLKGKNVELGDELDAARREREELTRAAEALRAEQALVAARVVTLEEEKVAASENLARTKSLLAQQKALLAQAVEDGADPGRSRRLEKEARDAKSLVEQREAELVALRTAREELSTKAAEAEAREKEAVEARGRADAALQKSLASAPDAGRLAVLEKEAAEATKRVSALDREVREAAEVAEKRERELEALRGERGGLNARIAALDAAHAKVQELERDLADRVRREKEWSAEKLRLEKRLAAREPVTPVAPTPVRDSPRPVVEIVRRSDGPLDVEGRVPVGSDLLVNGTIATVDSAGSFRLSVDVGPGRSVVLEQIDPDGVVRYFTYAVPEPR